MPDDMISSDIPTSGAGTAASSTKPMGEVIQIDQGLVRKHLSEVVRSTVEETLNAMLDAEAEQLCKAKR